MRTYLSVLVVAAFLAAQPAAAQDQSNAAPSQSEPNSGPVQEPSQPPPSEVPALPSSVPAPPSPSDQPVAEGSPNNLPQPPPQVAPAPAAPQAPGQWVYTGQYGWVWMPYGQNYTYVDQGGELAFTYAFYPTFGWRWLPAPWVFGWGATPYWGSYGCAHFAWYAHPWFRPGIYRPVVWEHWSRPYARGYGGAAYAHPGGVGYAHPVGGGYARPIAPVAHPAFAPRPTFAPHPAFAPRANFGGGGHGGGGGHHR